MVRHAALCALILVAGLAMSSQAAGAAVRAVDETPLWECDSPEACSAAFEATYAEAGWYGYNGTIDELVRTELSRFHGDTYMDYTGSGVYFESQLVEVFEDLRLHAYGNPHSANPSSHAATVAVEETRDLVLRFFGVTESTHSVIFTSGATGALKMVGEQFPWTNRSEFAYLVANHNSVLGIREQALNAGASGFCAVSADNVDRWLEQGPRDCTCSEPAFNLFAFPAEDNFAGVLYPLSWVERVKAMSTDDTRWMVLLDAAAFVPTQPLNLSAVPADFVSVSFYKMFGFPTGLGALIIRNEAADVLQKKYFGGGTITLVTAQDRFQVLKPRPSDRNEDGSVSFLGIPSLRQGFAVLQRLGGMGVIRRNGKPVIRVFGAHTCGPLTEDVCTPDHGEHMRQGSIVNLNVLNPAGEVVGYHTVETAATAAGIHLRVGCECNPGACFGNLGISDFEVEALLGSIKSSCGDEVDFIDVCPVEDKRKCSNDNAHEASMCARFGFPVHHPLTPGEDVDDGTPSPTVIPRKSDTDDAETAPWAVGASPGQHMQRKPIGSVRLSLGLMTTAIDVENVVKFFRENYQH